MSSNLTRSTIRFEILTIAMTAKDVVAGAQLQSKTDADQVRAQLVGLIP